MKNICAICGKEFETKYKWVTRCPSEECKAEHKRLIAEEAAKMTLWEKYLLNIERHHLIHEIADLKTLIKTSAK